MLLRTFMTLIIASPAVASDVPTWSPLVRDRQVAVAGPYIELWTNQDEVYRRGDRVRVYFRASEDAYITIFRIDTDGRVRVIFPTEPWEDNYARREQRYEVRSYGDNHAFMVDDYPGQGYIFAVASRDPFSYGALVRGDHWDYRVMASSGRITGDPYVALTDLVERIVPPNYAEYSYDILPYYVDQHYDYPRFLCYDCHSYASYSYWNPYAYNCFKFRIVIYDDPYYYPARYYGRPRVVYARSTRIAPRYVFKDRASPAQAFVTRVRDRPVDETGRRVIIDPGVTARDVGGVGRVPAPIESGRRTAPDRRDLTTSPDRRAVTDPNERQDVGREFEDGRRGVPEQRTEQGVRPDPDRTQPSGDRRAVERNRSDSQSGVSPRTEPQSPERRQLPQLERREEDRRPEAERQPERRPQIEAPREPVRAREPERRSTQQAPRAEPRSQPRSEPRQAAPRAEPRQSPPRSEPRQAQPRSEPRSQPRSAPAEREGESRRRSG